MDFQQGLEYLYGLQRFGIKLGLDNIRTLLARLGDPQREVACVHVAGTNGKGSVCAFLSESLRLSGLKVGLYTSPHLHCFTERIRIDGQPVSRAHAAELATDIRAASAGLPVTFFEATTAMALLAFRCFGVSIAIMETGLGGRLDATNVIQPVLSMITPVSFDHQEHLGDSLSGIAAEKAGIIKPGTPLIVGRQEAEALAVILATATERSAPVCQVGLDYRWRGSHDDLCVDACGRTLSGLQCSLVGEHQLDNLAQAIAGALTLRGLGWPISDEALGRAGRSARWPGRLEWWRGSPAILLDAAHNAAGMSSLATYLRQQGLDGAPVLVGLSGGRRPDEVLKPLAGLVGDMYAVPVPVGGSVDPALLADWAHGQGMAVRIFDSAEAGFQTARAACPGELPLVVCGSLFLVAAIRDILTARLSDTHSCVPAP